MTQESPAEGRDALAEALGVEAADTVRARLAEVGFVVVDIEELAALEREAGAYRQMRQLVEGP